MKTITIHAGHNPDGKKGSGAVGILKESTECRKIEKKVRRRMRRMGYDIHSITVNNGKDAADVLERLYAKAYKRWSKRKHKKQINISLHMNAAGKSANGTEILYNPRKSKKPSVHRFANKMEKIGFRWRGVVDRDNLYILNRFPSDTYIIELCFVGNANDAKLYRKNINKIVDAVCAFIADNGG